MALIAFCATLLNRTALGDALSVLASRDVPLASIKNCTCTAMSSVLAADAASGNAGRRALGALLFQAIKSPRWCVVAALSPPSSSISVSYTHLTLPTKA